MNVHLVSTGVLALTVDCTGVNFSLDGSNVRGPGDDACIKAGLDEVTASIKSFTYDGDTFTLVMAKSILQLQIKFEHVNIVDAAPVIHLAHAPTGVYHGTKSVLGIDIDGTLNVTSATKVDVDVEASGGISVKCANEDYKMNGDVVVLPTDTTAGDCIHDSLAEYGLKIKSITYNEADDSIELDIKKSLITIKIILTHTGMTYRVEFDAPSGTYEGTKSVLGIKIDGKLKIDSTTKVDVDVEAPSDNISVLCPEETYELDGSKVTLPGLDTAGDCVHDKL